MYTKTYDNLNITYPDRPFRPRGIQKMNQRVQSMVDVLTLMRKWSNNQSVDHSPQCVVVVTISIISTTCLVHSISSLYAYIYIYYQGILWVCKGRGHQNGPMALLLLKYM